MAHKKGQGAAKNGRDSTSKRRGVKKFGGEFVLGRDYTLFALKDGTVKWDGAHRKVSVVASE